MKKFKQLDYIPTYDRNDYTAALLFTATLFIVVIPSFFLLSLIAGIFKLSESVFGLFMDIAGMLILASVVAAVVTYIRKYFTKDGEVSVKVYIILFITFSIISTIYQIITF